MSELSQHSNSKPTNKQLVSIKPTTKRSSGGKPKPKPIKSNTTTTTTKQPPLKVVYISNPMRVEVRETEFRALVQELTGWDSSVRPVPTRPGPVGDQVMNFDDCNDNDDNDHGLPELPETSVGNVGPDLGSFGLVDGGCQEGDDQMMMMMDMIDFSTYFHSLQQ